MKTKTEAAIEWVMDLSVDNEDIDFEVRETIHQALTQPSMEDELAEALEEKKLNAEFWMRTDAVHNEAYYQGKRDAFDEIIEALAKYRENKALTKTTE